MVKKRAVNKQQATNISNKLVFIVIIIAVIIIAILLILKFIPKTEEQIEPETERFLIPNTNYTCEELINPNVREINVTSSSKEIRINIAGLKEIVRLQNNRELVMEPVCNGLKIVNSKNDGSDTGCYGSFILGQDEAYKVEYSFNFNKDNDCIETGKYMNDISFQTCTLKSITCQFTQVTITGNMIREIDDIQSLSFFDRLINFLFGRA
jgi:hypothetical protein